MLKTALRLVLAKKPSKFVFRKSKVFFPSFFENVGFYLHIPFCRQICPFCPYNKILYDPQKAALYEDAVIKELMIYKKIIKNTKIPSLYIGGGTPTTMTNGLLRIINFIKNNFNLGNEIGMEIHPQDATQKILRELKNMGVNMISLGVQSFNDRLLKILGRNYNGKIAQQALEQVIQMGFKSVDVDILFAIPTETPEEAVEDVRKVISLGADQISSYPLIVFSFTKMPAILKTRKVKKINMFREKRMLDLIAKLASDFSYKRTSIWTFTKKGSSRYTSVTREGFVGIGAGAASFIGDYFYINTFSVDEYIKILKKELPIALVTQLSKKEQMAWWLFWRFYDTHISKDRFKQLFGRDIDKVFWWLFPILLLSGMTKEERDDYKLTSRGAFLFSLIEQAYSLDYLNNTWATLSKNPWPKKLNL